MCRIPREAPCGQNIAIIVIFSTKNMQKKGARLVLNPFESPGHQLDVLFFFWEGGAFLGWGGRGRGALIRNSSDENVTPIQTGKVMPFGWCHCVGARHFGRTIAFNSAMWGGPPQSWHLQGKKHAQRGGKQTCLGICGIRCHSG